MLVERLPTRRRGRYSFEVGGSLVDFSPALGLPGPRNVIDRITGLLLGWLANRRVMMRLKSRMDRREAARRLESLSLE